MKFRIKGSLFLITAFTLIVLSLSAFCHAAPLTIAAQGKSTFAIIVPQIAAVSVNDAATELQRDIAEATGAKLPIRKDNEPHNGSFISLGSTLQAKQAGISTKDIPYDGYRITRQGDNLFIIGIDTTAEPTQWRSQTAREIVLHPEIPGPAFTDMGGFSNGTANGVYSFLEEELGVRWLFPGDLGRDVPERSTLAVEVTDRRVAPLFNFRILSIFRGGDDWRARQKLNYSVNIRYNHNFSQTVSADLYETHPDWFPMINGKRPKPEGGNYKLETTNPELVQYFAEKAIEALKTDPQLYTYSLSPSDSRGWSESPESKALYDPPSSGKGVPSMTPLVLKFYRDVAAIVAKEYPQGTLGGFIYQDFSSPPQQGGMELPENFIPMIVGKSLGYRFYRPDTRELEEEFLNEWAKVAPSNWYYYGMPTWLRESSAQVTPAAPKELNTLYHAMVKAHIKGAQIYGTDVMSQGALVNYINAKMLWDPTGDAVAIQRDWLWHAYGPKAGAVMEQLYNKLDESWFSDYFRSPQSTHYNVSEVMFRNTFGAHYPKMEKLFLEAWNQPMTEKQKARLDLIRQNMIALQFRLRNAGYLLPEYSSPLTRSAKEVFGLLTDEGTRNNFASGLVARDGGAVSPVKTELGSPETTAGKSASIPNADKVWLFPTQDGEVTMKPFDVLPGSNFLTYYLQDAKGNTLQRGLLSGEDEIKFAAKANQPYYFSLRYRGVTVRPQVKWKIFIPGAVPATATFKNDVLYLNPTAKGEAAPLYVFTPPSLHLELESDARGIVVQTESDDAAHFRAEREFRRQAQTALAEASKRYQADLVLSLNRQWKFATDPEKIGDEKGYFVPEFDDAAWNNFSTFGYWRDQGFSDYHGTAWYRNTFKLSDDQTDPLAMGDKQLLLFFGAIDGDAEIYLNGIKIADRIMAEHAYGWNQPLAFNISGAAHTGKNNIAVKVTKDRLAAGIYRGVSILAGIPPAADK